MKTLIIFALIGLISYSKSQLDPTLIQSFIFKCPDDKKIKIGEDVCLIASNEKGTINTYDPVIYIKKKVVVKKKNVVVVVHITIKIIQILVNHMILFVLVKRN